MLMRTVAEHQAAVAALLPHSAAVRVSLAEAAGHALASDVHAGLSLPGFDNSAMDGYAVRAVDVESASRDQPVELPVLGEIPAGRVDVEALRPGSAHRIMTGAPMPPGADAVVQVEVTDAGTETVLVFEPRAVGTHVRAAGMDVRVGDLVLRAGTALGPPQLGLLAALGLPVVEVAAPLRVLVLSTGSELVEPGRPLRAGQLHESNGIMLTAAINEAGACAEQAHFVGDDVAQFHAALGPRLHDVDLVVTSGGVSAGAYEVVKDALADAEVRFTKVAMQPGMPQGLGMLKGVPIVCLPGNPVSAYVSFEVFVRPALRAAMGFAATHRHVVRARLSPGVGSPLGKRQFRGGLLEPRSGRVSLVGSFESHLLASLATSNCLVDIGAETDVVRAGDLVDVWLLA